MGDSFWDLTEGEVITSDERAVEVIRRCSSASVFKQVMSKLGVVIDYARRLQPIRPMFIEGRFKTDRNLEAVWNGIPSKVVLVELKVNSDRDKFLMGSHFYIVVSNEGRIIGVSNMLI